MEAARDARLEGDEESGGAVSVVLGAGGKVILFVALLVADGGLLLPSGGYSSVEGVGGIRRSCNGLRGRADNSTANY